MQTEIRRWEHASAYGVATVIDVYDHVTDEVIHIVRQVIDSNGRVYKNIRCSVTERDIPEGVVKEGLNAIIQEVIKAG